MLGGTPVVGCDVVLMLGGAGCCSFFLISNMLGVTSLVYYRSLCTWERYQPFHPIVLLYLSNSFRYRCKMDQFLSFGDLSM